MTAAAAWFVCYADCFCCAWTPGRVPERCPEHQRDPISQPELVPVTPAAVAFGLWHEDECLGCPHPIKEDV